MTEQEQFEAWFSTHPDFKVLAGMFGNPFSRKADGSYWLSVVRTASDAWQAAQQKEGYVFVKPQLDSDVKAKMIGEYNVPASSICPDCTGEGCCECNNTGTISQNVTVSWTTVKQIYRDGIFFMAQAAQEPT